jgi:phosphoheptose isomerase
LADALLVTEGLPSATGVVLAGGFGTRLRPALCDRPKVLAEVNGRPFLFILLDQLADAGVCRIVVCTGHLGDQVRAAVGDTHRGVPVVYSHETSPLGTGGAVRQAFVNFPDELFLVVNGDSYVAADLGEFRRVHQANGQPGSLLLTWVDDSARFGTVETAADGRILRFMEKRGIAEPGWINGGMYLLSRALLETLPPEAPLSIERDVFPDWVQRGLGGYCVRAPFIDIGTPESLASAAAFFAGLAGRRKRFAVVDRDGAIIVQKRYLSSPDEVELLPNAAAGIRRLRELGLGVVVATNQSPVGRGYFGMDAVDRVNSRMAALLAAEGATIDRFYICPHTPDDACACRKPNPGLLLQASLDFAFDPAAAFVIGDKDCDIDMGRNCGSTTFLVETGYGREHLAKGWAKPDFVVRDLAEAANYIDGILKDSSMETAEQALVVGAAERLRKHLLGSIAAKRRVLEECEPAILAAAGVIASSITAGGKMLLCGNGGSAADCQHIAGEMVSVLNQNFPRPGLAAIAMTTDSSILTASANDFGYDGVFERQVQALGKPGDVVVGISTSGNSENVLRALCYAGRNGMRTIGMTGASGGRMAEESEIAIKVPSACVQHIQEAHITIGHILCDLVERTLFPAQS